MCTIFLLQTCSTIDFALISGMYSGVFSRKTTSRQHTKSLEEVILISRTYNGNCFKIASNFLIQFSNKMLVIKAGIHKMLVRIKNREDPDQTVSSEAV